MEFIKPFEEFINSAYKNQAPLIEDQASGADDIESSIIPESAKRKLWEYMHEMINAAVDYENDDDDNHKLENCMKENAAMMAALAAKSLKENAALIAMAAKAANESADEEDAATKKQMIQEYVKKRLDEACGKLHEGFKQGIDKALNDNAGMAALVAAEMMKDDK